ncbi:MAG TPA: DNA replication and repair protein RecF [Candidatus Baltobacteraceae bacterium]|nr:DNA replication and repair protein RecF [Candidatus Baltobacteraceae bacterium]
MRVDRLVVTGFRSYDQLVLDPPPGPQILYGANAAGKTNLVEALVVLARGTSHRAGDAELPAWSGALARLEAAVSHGPGHGPDVLEVVIPRAAPGATSRKRIRLNGVPRRAPALGQALRVVLFAPEEMLLVVGSPALRRAALDALAAARSPGHGRALATYGRALAQRNSLLRAIREGAAARDQLSYWDGLIVDEGGAVVAGRLDTLVDLAEPLAAAHAEIAPGEGRLAMAYVSNAPPGASETPAEAIRRRLAETAEKEVWNGATLVGPHRDDIVFQLDDRPLAAFASRGQQRTAILALKLAEVHLLTTPDGEPPLLLLDDVFSELDPLRRAHLVRRIQALPQAFITTTALADLDPELVAASTAWRVTPGRIERSGG